MAMDTTYPPDEFIQNGKIVGFDADLGVALGKVLGVKVTLETATFDTIIPGIEDGKFDVGNSSFTDTKAREKVVDFVDYFKAGEGFYEKATSTKTFNGLKSLCGHTVSVETGTTEQSDAESQAKRCHVTVLSYEDQNQANLAVSDGRADLGFGDSQVVAYIVHLSNGQFKLTGTPFETAPYGFAVAKNSGLAETPARSRQGHHGQRSVQADPRQVGRAAGRHLEPRDQRCHQLARASTSVAALLGARDSGKRSCP